jgi:hypothetical protein
MKHLLILMAFLGACAEPCEILPRQNYRLVLVNQDPESFFCFTQAPEIDFTDDITLADSFTQGCTAVVTRSCGATDLTVDCKVNEVKLSCKFTGYIGSCVNDLTALTCHYDAWLDQIR